MWLSNINSILGGTHLHKCHLSRPVKFYIPGWNSCQSTPSFLRAYFDTPFLIRICDPYVRLQAVRCMCSVADAAIRSRTACNESRWVKYNRSQRGPTGPVQAAGSLPVQLVISGRLLGTDLTPTWPTT